MMRNRLYSLLTMSVFVFLFSCKKENPINSDFIIYQTNSKNDKVTLFWKNDKNEPLKNFKNLKELTDSKNENLKFAMNGGMFIKNNIPKGLYIENYQNLNAIDTLTGEGNFYLKPNGIFYITTSNDYKILTSENFRFNSEIKYATQSGPMLIVDGEVNPIFQKKSKNLNIRNGVGILKSGEVVFAMSKKEINFYDFAELFKNLGCQNALYLDGFVSRSYFPQEQWVHEDGDFGVMIGVTNKN